MNLKMKIITESFEKQMFLTHNEKFSDFEKHEITLKLFHLFEETFLFIFSKKPFHRHLVGVSKAPEIFINGTR